MLDVACGPGFPALTAAEAVRPEGSIVAVDLAPDMIRVVRARASARGLTNVTAAVMDAEHLDFGAATFDAVMNAYGLMFSLNPAAVVDEMRRVSKPGGRVAVVVWDELEASAFFSVLLPIARQVLGLPAPDPALPGPFSLAPAERLRAVLLEGGLTEPVVDRVSMTVELASVDEYCRIFADVALKARMSSMTSDETSRLKREVAEAVSPWTQPDGRLRLSAASLCGRGDVR